MMAIAGSWWDSMPTEPGPDRDRWLKLHGWDSYEEWQEDRLTFEELMDEEST